LTLSSLVDSDAPGLVATELAAGDCIGAVKVGLGLGLSPPVLGVEEEEATGRAEKEDLLVLEIGATGASPGPAVGGD
jgi:hypothetical protein